MLSLTKETDPQAIKKHSKLNRKQFGAIRCFLILYIANMLAMLVEPLRPIYDLVPHIDKIFHFLGGYFVAQFFIEYFRDRFSGVPTLMCQVLAVGGAVITFGVLWEFYEYTLDVVMRYAHGSPCCIGDLDDTLGDILFDSFGGVFYIWLYRIQNKK